MPIIILTMIRSGFLSNNGKMSPFITIIKVLQVHKIHLDLNSFFYQATPYFLFCFHPETKKVRDKMKIFIIKNQLFHGIKMIVINTLKRVSWSFNLSFV